MVHAVCYAFSSISGISNIFKHFQTFPTHRILLFEFKCTQCSKTYMSNGTCPHVLHLSFFACPQTTSLLGSCRTELCWSMLSFLSFLVWLNSCLLTFAALSFPAVLTEQFAISLQLKWLIEVVFVPHPTAHHSPPLVQEMTGELTAQTSVPPISSP